MSKEIVISTCTGGLTRLGTPEKVVDTLKEAGFKYYDFTMMYPILGFELFYNSDDYLDKARKFRQYTDNIDIYCNQTHGATPYIVKNASKEDNETLFDNVKRTIEVSHVLGAKYCVLHPSSDCSIKENAERFLLLKQIAIDNQVIIAIENMPTGGLFGRPEHFIELLDIINDDHFKVCLDIGHAEIDLTHSSAVKFINKLGDRIACLHIHDNNQAQDIHQLPYTYAVNFEEIVKALKDNHYQGDITFEATTFMNHMPITLFLDNLKILHDVGEYLLNQIYS